MWSNLKKKYFSAPDCLRLEGKACTEQGSNAAWCVIFVIEIFSSRYVFLTCDLSSPLAPILCLYLCIRFIASPDFYPAAYLQGNGHNCTPCLWLNFPWPRSDRCFSIILSLCTPYVLCQWDDLRAKEHAISWCTRCPLQRGLCAWGLLLLPLMPELTPSWWNELPEEKSPPRAWLKANGLGHWGVRLVKVSSGVSNVTQAALRAEMGKQINPARNSELV